MLRLPEHREDRHVKHTQRTLRAHAVAAEPAAPHASRPRHIQTACQPRPEYDRRTTLCRVLALWPQEAEDESAAGRLRIVAKLRKALRAERQRGLAGHWTYDLARHADLLRVYKQELQALDGLGVTVPNSSQ